MKKEDLDALAGLYEGVYSPANNGEYLVEELNLQEAPMTAFQAAGGNAKLAQLNKGRSPRAGRVTASQLERQGQENLFKAGGGNAAIAKGPTRTQNVRGGSTRQVPTLTRQDIINRGTVAAAKPAAKPAATAPAARPASGGMGGPQGSAARPATPGSGAKVAPTASKATTPAKPAGSAMDQWAAANPKLAAAKAERDRTRGTSATTNPLMKDFKDRLPAPKSPSPSTSSTAFAKTTPALSSPSKTPAPTLSSKPTTNQTSTAFSSPSLVKPTPSTTPIKKPGAVMASFEWGSKATLKDVASLYSSIYEGKKKDQDQDGDNDFADVRIARMIASGMSKAEAIAAVKNKEYNEEFESWVDSLVEEGYDLSDYTMDEMFDIYLDEAEGSYGATPKAYSAARKTKMTAKRNPFLKKMLSRTNPANRTSPYSSPRKGMTADDRESARAGSKHGVGTRQEHDYPSEGPGGVTKSAKKLRKQKAMGEFGEAYEIDEATRMRKELGKEGETATRKELAARSKAYKRSGSVDKTIAAAERGADRPYIKHKRDESEGDRTARERKQSQTLRGLAASRRGSVRDKPRAGMRGYAAKVEGGDKDLQSARQKAMSAGTLTPKEKKQLGEVYEIVASYLLENNFAATLNDANVIIENMSEVWLSQILESAE